MFKDIIEQDSKSLDQSPSIEVSCCAGDEERHQQRCSELGRARPGHLVSSQIITIRSS
jgi:hypothetical protein